MTSKQWVASDKTHYEPIDFAKPEQWLFGCTLRTYPKAIILGNGFNFTQVKGLICGMKNI